MKILISLALLLLGVAIYVVFRNDVMFLQPVKGYLPNEVTFQLGVWGYLLVFNLPDALWYASLLMLQPNIFTDDGKNKTITFAVFALPFLHEAAQAFKLVPGTFDWIDILFYALTLLIFITKWKKENEYLRAASSNSVV